MSVRWWAKHHVIDVSDVVLENLPRRLSIVEAEEPSQFESYIITDKTSLGCRKYVVQQASSVGGRQCLYTIYNVSDYISLLSLIDRFWYDFLYSCSPK